MRLWIYLITRILKLLADKRCSNDSAFHESVSQQHRQLEPFVFEGHPVRRVTSAASVSACQLIHTPLQQSRVYGIVVSSQLSNLLSAVPVTSRCDNCQRLHAVPSLGTWPCYPQSAYYSAAWLLYSVGQRAPLGDPRLGLGDLFLRSLTMITIRG